MRRFTFGSATDRKVVVIDLDGPRMSVVRIMPDGSTKRTEQVLGSEAAARAASDQLARELVSRGYKEKVGRSVKQAREAARASAAAAAAAPGIDEIDGSSLFDEIEEPVAAAAPVLQRVAVAPAASPAVEAAPKKKKKAGGKKKKRKKAEDGDGLDRRVLAGIGAAAFAFFGMLGYIAYDAFLKPPTIIGTWRGSLLEHEVSRKLSHTKYDLILDEQRRASLTLQEKYTSTGTYSLKGDLLRLSLKDEDDNPSEREYKIVLGRRTLDLKGPRSGELAVQLLRFDEKPTIGGKPAGPAAPTDLGAIDKDADAKLASVEMSPKDGAFKVRYPKGWESDTGSRPDNTYSWCKFTKGAATIEVRADIQGSLISGSDSRREPQPEGSEMAPVHIAHEAYRKTASEDFSDYSESKPAVFKGAGLGEGRIAEFTASAGALFKTKLRGYHVTLLTNDRRVSIICQCPDKEFATYRPAFLAVCRSLSR